MKLSHREFTLFVCFASQDQDWYQRLDKHLSLLKEREGIAIQMGGEVVELVIIEERHLILLK